MEIQQQPPTANELASVYLQAGWIDTADPEKMTRAVESGSEWYVARNEEGMLEGIGRFMSDLAFMLFLKNSHT